MYLICGPRQAWQSHRNQLPSDIKPLHRLHRTGNRGLPIGKDYRYAGSIREDVATKLESRGEAWITTHPIHQIPWIYPTQSAFIFT